MNPVAVTYHRDSCTLELDYGDTKAVLSAELLRVYSPSAEVRGHSDAERVLQTGKKHVGIEEIQAVGNYAIRIVFDDGHDTGIYSWDFLKDLHDRRDEYWRDYLTQLKQANASRLPAIPIGHWSPPHKP
ncbi:MAG: DUF971 domain-containing protein [Gammaproteobacteria bacterium]|nr:DUF971 domain-containing protein [Gammaproteobacteria bacterium]